MGKPSSRWENKDMLDHVRTMPCAYTHKPAEHVHHLIGMGGMSGWGLKAPDWAVIPVTSEVHEQIHNDPEMQKTQPMMILKNLEKLFNEGRLVFVKKGN
ncbi:MAG: DUF968 domain-containing protein [Pseudomonadota bacterium]